MGQVAGGQQADTLSVGCLMRLRPFFSYYGSKYLLAPHYPAPQHDTVIEPFAGSAGYSLLHFEHDIYLFDVNPVIVELWEFLIGATRGDILSLPLEITDLREMDLPAGAKHLIGFWLVRSASHPGNVPHGWMRTGIYGTSFWSAEKRQRVADQVQYIRHWQVAKGSYCDVPDVTATWFVDPPYRKHGCGSRYRFNRIDYDALALWSLTRDGQVIVTEQDGADWLPFIPFRMTRTPTKGARSSLEAVWTNV